MILIVNMNNNPLALYEFVLPIASIVKRHGKYDIKHYSEIQPEKLGMYSGIILSGTTLKEDKYLGDIKKFEWIKEFDKPVLGICAGMQVISLVFGSKLSKCKEIGMVDIRTVKDNPLFSSSFESYALHNYAIDPSDKLDVLAKSANCVEAVKVKDKNAYGVLFHPEVRNKEIIERFCSGKPE